MDKTLIDRLKHTHLTYEQKLLIYRVYWYEDRTRSQYFNRMKDHKAIRLNIRRQELYSEIRWRKNIDFYILAEWISDFVRQKTGWFDLIHLQRHIKTKLLIVIPLHQIRKYLKKKEHLSYKKGSSRPIDLNVERLRLLKILFWIRLV